MIRMFLITALLALTACGVDGPPKPVTDAEASP